MEIESFNICEELRAGSGRVRAIEVLAAIWMLDSSAFLLLDPFLLPILS